MLKLIKVKRLMVKQAFEMKLIMSQKMIRCLVLISLTLFSCGRNDSMNESIRNIEPMEEWRKDSIGCLHIRNEKLAVQLIEDLDLVGKDTNEFKKIFGLPNEMQYFQGGCYLGYYFESTCNDNSIEGDKSRIDFKFRNNELLGKEEILIVTE